MWGLYPPNRKEYPEHVFAPELLVTHKANHPEHYGPAPIAHFATLRKEIKMPVINAPLAYPHLGINIGINYSLVSKMFFFPFLRSVCSPRMFQIPPIFSTLAIY